MVRSPCYRCTSFVCVLGARRADCLKDFPELRSMANRPEGFKGASYDEIALLPLNETLFYDRMTGDKNARDLL